MSDSIRAAADSWLRALEAKEEEFASPSAFTAYDDAVDDLRAAVVHDQRSREELRYLDHIDALAQAGDAIVKLTSKPAIVARRQVLGYLHDKLPAGVAPHTVRLPKPAKAGTCAKCGGAISKAYL